MSNDYQQQRTALLDAEVDLMHQREHVAALRRALPPGPAVPDYVFEDSNGGVRLSELFTGPQRSLVLYHFMFGKAQTDPCASCTMWTDGFAAIADRLVERFDLAIVTAAPMDATRALAERPGWERLRWLSAANNTFKRDIGGEDPDGSQMPFVSVYRRGPEGPYLSYSGGAHLRGDDWRGIDLLSPAWHLLDLTPEGRGDWMPSTT